MNRNRMKLSSTTLFASALTLLLGASVSHAAPVATLYTGGDPGEGLDLQNDALGFVYALDFRASGGSNLTVDDVTFNPVTASSAPAGVTITTYFLPSDFLAPFDLGATTNDDNLESIAQSTVQVSSSPNRLDLTLAVTPGRPYQLQLIMFGNGAPAAPRPASYTINGVTTLVTLATTASGSPITSSYVVTDTFTPAGSSTQIVIVHDSGGDNDSFAQGLTLELLPEPASLGLVMLGSAALLRRRRA